MATTLKVSVPQHLRSKVGATKDGDKFGKTTGLRMTHFADALLEANSKAHETDDVLQATLQAEFPKRMPKGKGVKGESGRVIKTIQAISAYRAYYNAQKHGHNPLGRSAIAYNAEGQPRSSGESKPKAKGKGKAKGAKAKASKANGKANGKPKAKAAAKAEPAAA